MGKRNARVQEEQQAQAYEQGQQQAAAPPPPPPAPAPADPTVEKINQLAQLHASGALTDEEFAAAKAQALGI
jgi:Short C-terminal domain